MQLKELLKYKQITIQCHDNPDPDALASAYGLYLYFKENGKNPRVIYGGRNPITKSNIRLMMDEIGIKADYVTDKETPISGLLLTADCQVGEGNVTPFKADEFAVIDHHQTVGMAMASMDKTEVHPYLGSCSTLIWKMLKEEDFDIDSYKNLGTAFYYGLMTDTGNFAELRHPLDRDMIDDLKYDKSLVHRFCNSNISLEELKIAGIALVQHEYDVEHRFALVGSEPCDPNILGLISDLALQVDSVDTCIVYNETPDGYKFSVRSCVKEVHANDFAEFIANGIGSGGGHVDKAGGFISKSKFQRIYGDKSIQTFIKDTATSYFDDTEIIYTSTYNLDTTGMETYVKKSLVIGYADPADFLEMGTNVMIRSLEGDVENVINGEYFVMIGIRGEVYPILKSKFATSYDVVDENYSCETEYQPTIRNLNDGIIYNLTHYAHSCVAKDISQKLAKPLDHRVKIFTEWDQNSYYLGKVGDYIVCRPDDFKDIYIVEKNIFLKSYDRIED